MICFGHIRRNRRQRAQAHQFDYYHLMCPIVHWHILILTLGLTTATTTTTTTMTTTTTTTIDDTLKIESESNSNNDHSIWNGPCSMGNNWINSLIKHVNVTPTSSLTSIKQIPFSKTNLQPNLHKDSNQNDPCTIFSFISNESTSINLVNGQGK